MELPAVEDHRCNGRAVRSENPILDQRVTSAEAKLDKLQRVGFRMILLGFTPEKSVLNCPIQVVVRWGCLIVFYAACTTYELCNSFIFSRNLLEMVAHAYIATYVGAFAFQWAYFYRITPKLFTDRIRLEDFHCTKNEPESTEKISDENVKILKKVLIVAAIWLATNNASHLLGPIIEAAVTLIGGGEVNQIFILPHVFQYPIWAQIIIYVWNFGTTFGLLVYTVGSYTVIGVQVAKIKILCEILNAALINAEDGRNIRDYIADHVKIIK